MNCKPFTLFFACLAAACTTPRVILPTAPDANAPLVQRAEYYRQFGMASTIRTTTTTYSSSGYVRSQSRALTRIELKNGAEIHDPRDLLPAVNPQSATAIAAIKFGPARSLEKAESTLRLSSHGLWVAGSATLLTGFLTRNSASDSTQQALFLGGVGSIALGLTGLLASLVMDMVTPDDSTKIRRNQAFGAYDEDLRNRLNVREDGAEWHPQATPTTH